MSIATELQRIQTGKEDIKVALDRIGIEIPSGSTIDEFAQYIDPFSSGKTVEWMDNPSNFLSFKFITSGTVQWQNVMGDIQYSKDGGATWTAFNGATVNCNADDEIWFKGALTGGCGYDAMAKSSKFITTGNFYASGNMQALCSFSNTLKSYHFAFCFCGCRGLNISEEKMLILPASTVTSYCYMSMFENCTSLAIAPAILPATNVNTYYCYQYMFRSCASLRQAPVLPATTLGYGCYWGMFISCSSLVVAPELPATAVSQYGYYCMFDGCASLTTVPSLPIQKTNPYCCQSMFHACPSLTTIPSVLPASALTTSCYYSMFSGCTSLVNAPELPATVLSANCYYQMFQGCISLTGAPQLPATALSTNCYCNMFNNCISLKTAPELPATILSTNCYNCSVKSDAGHLCADAFGNCGFGWQASYGYPCGDL